MPSARPVKESIRAIRVSLLDQRHSSVVTSAGRHWDGPKLASKVTVSPTGTTLLRALIGARSRKQLSSITVPSPHASSTIVKADTKNARDFEKLKVYLALGLAV